MTTSKYYQDASAQHQQELVVAKRNAEMLRNLEEKVKAVRTKENRAVVAIKNDLKSKQISAATAMIEEAKVHANAMTEAETIKAQIKEIVPNWREDLIGKAKVLSDKAAVATVKSADVGGKGIGSALRTPWQAGKRFFNSVKENANQEFQAFKDEVQSED